MAIRLQKPGLENVYGHITEYYSNKIGDRSQFPVKWYLNDSKEVVVDPNIHGLSKMFCLDISAEKGPDKIEKIAYNKIGSILKEDGFLPQSDESGEWMDY